MNATTTVLWGKNGCGKTTVAVNLACALAARNQLTGIISANLYFGEAQVHLKCPISEEKGLHKALSGQQINLNEQFVKSGLHDNVFLLALPNQFDALDNTEITAEQASRVLSQAAIYFDYLLIDGSAELQNPFTYLAMEQSKYVVTLYKPSITACLWHNAMARVREQLYIKDKLLPVLNAYDHSCDMEGFVRQTGLYFKHELPYVPAAPMCENSGTSIYLQTDKQSRRYARSIDALAAALCEREG